MPTEMTAIQEAAKMSEAELAQFLSVLDLYTSFFLLLIALSFAAFITVLLVLIKNIKSRKSLQENRVFLSETISAQEEERRRISQELHDTVSQNIKALLLEEKELAAEMEKLKQVQADGRVSQVDERLSAHLEKIIGLEKQNQKELRSIIQNLAIPALEGAPFKTRIADVCEQFKEQTNIPCNLFVAPDATLDGFSTEQKHHILRIIQEALHNAAAHAKPGETSVVIRKTPDPHGGKQLLRVMVFDDGTGFSPDRSKSGLHFGMSGMEMRVRLLGGTLAVHSAPDTGTEVRLEVPLETPAEEISSLP